MKRTSLLLACFCFAVSLAAGRAPVRVAAGGLLLLIAALRDRAALTAFGSYRIWIFPVLFIALSPFVFGEPRLAVGGLTYSLDQLRSGARFLFHAYCFVVFGAFLSRSLSLPATVRIAERLGLAQPGLRIALGGAAAKILSRMVRETYGTYRMARPSFLAAARESPILLGAIARNTALVAERISILFYIRDIRVGPPGAAPRASGSGSGKPGIGGVP